MSREMRTILVGVDLPDENRAEPDPILATAVALAEATGARLHIVHAVESGPLQPPLPPSLSQQMETAGQALGRYLEAALPDTVTVSDQAVHLGRAHTVLAEQAAAAGADLVVVGPHRGGNFQAQFLGTTADRLLRTVNVPCWVVRGPLALPLMRLGVPVDFSPVSSRALDVALRLARALGGADGVRGAAPPELHLLHVEWPVTLEDDPECVERDLVPRLLHEFDQARGRTSLGNVATARPTVQGAVDPSRGILAYADDHELPLMVLGTHGRGAVARALLGDVASIVARRARAHVVLVPPAPGTDGR